MAEYLIPISIEYLKEGEYLATSPVLQGFIAQGRTIEIAEDVARKIIESCIEHGDPLPENLPIGTSPNFKLDINIPVPVPADK